MSVKPWYQCLIDIAYEILKILQRRVPGLSVYFDYENLEPWDWCGFGTVSAGSGETIVFNMKPGDYLYVKRILLMISSGEAWLAVGTRRIWPTETRFNVHNLDVGLDLVVPRLVEPGNELRLYVRDDGVNDVSWRAYLSGFRSDIRLRGVG